MSICASSHFSVCYTRFTRKRLNRLSQNCVSLNTQRVASFSVGNNGEGEPYMRKGGVNFFTEYDHAGYQTKDLNQCFSKMILFLTLGRTQETEDSKSVPQKVKQVWFSEPIQPDNLKKITAMYLNKIQTSKNTSHPDICSNKVKILACFNILEIYLKIPPS